jgi:hypothetical protein
MTPTLRDVTCARERRLRLPTQELRLVPWRSRPIDILLTIEVEAFAGGSSEALFTPCFWRISRLAYLAPDRWPQQRRPAPTLATCNGNVTA